MDSDREGGCTSSSDSGSERRGAAMVLKGRAGISGVAPAKRKRVLSRTPSREEEGLMLSLRAVIRGWGEEVLEKLTGVRKKYRFSKAIEATLAEEITGLQEVLVQRVEKTVEAGLCMFEAGRKTGEHLTAEMRQLREEVREIKAGLSAVGARGGAAAVVPKKVGLTYAERVKTAASRPPTRTVIVKAPAGTNKTVDEVKAQFKELVKPTAEGLKVTALRKGRSGVVVTLGDDASWQTVMRHQRIKEQGLKVEAPEKRMPRLAIYGMDRALDKEELVKTIHQQNLQGKLTHEEATKELVPLFRTGRRDNVRGAWVVRCSARVRGWLQELGRVFIGWDSCRVEDVSGVTRCYRCQGYGHTSARCNSKPMCGHCAEEGHDRKECQKRDTPAKCGNCKRFGKEYHHDVASRECPYYLRQLELVTKITDYGR